MKTVEILKTIKSTNEYLLNFPSEDLPKEGKAVATFDQTEGRGQKGNKWLSEPGCNICYSLLFHPEKIPAQNQFLISQAAALGVKKFFDEFTQNITIKWPNDIFYKNNKIAGILIENKLTGSMINFSVIGIGININQKTFPAELTDAISLTQITGKEYDLNELTEKLHETVWKSLSDMNLERSGDIQRYYINSLFRRDGYHSYTDKDGTFMAKILGVGAQGDLMLELEDNSVRSYTFKKIQFNL